MKSLLIAAALFALPHVAGAQSTRVYPNIGTPAYSAGCEITHEWEDGAAVAYCPEDGATWAYDPDGFAAYDHGILFRGTPPGWTEVK